MEHDCSQCGAVVVDGRPFCEKCHAPQIRVPVHPPTAPVTEPLPPGTPEDLQPPAEPMVSEPRRVEARVEPILADGTYPLNKLIWRPAFGAALVAGMLAAVGTFIPIVPLAMLCMFASGGLVVTLYRRRAAYRTVTPWMGAKLGVLTGGIGFGLHAFTISLLLIDPGGRTAIRAQFVDKMQEAIGSTADPNVRQAIERFRSAIATDHGLVLVVIFFLAVAAVFFLTFSALGGALGAALFGRDDTHKE